MGYTTDFWGEWTITPSLKPEHKAYLEAFANTRRVKRDASIVENMYDPIRVAAGLPVGHEGAYYVGGDGFKGQNGDPSIIDGNEPPGTSDVWEAAIVSGQAQPGLWCQWIPLDDDTLGWDGGEKFYHYINWIEYLINHFLNPWGYELDGEVHWQGEDTNDRGVIRIQGNVVEVGHAEITYKF